MAQTDDEFLKDLRRQCLSDSMEYFAEYREVLPKMQQDPLKVLSTLLKISHTLKGNLQAAGFPHCANFVHSVESLLNQCEAKIKEYIKDGSKIVAEKDLQFLEFLFSEAMQNVEAYFRELMEKTEDCEEICSRRLKSLDLLGRWHPDSEIVEEASSGEVAKSVSESVAVTTNENDPVTLALLAALAEEEPKPMTTPATAPVGMPVKRLPMEEVQLEDTRSLYLLCKNGARHFGIEISDIVEVVQSSTMIPLPCERPDLLGLVNLRGEIMPILNLLSTLETVSDAKSGNGTKKYIVVCNVKGHQFGFPIEEAEQVIEMDRASFQSAEKVASIGSASLVTHFSLVEDKTVLIMNLGGALAA